MSPPDPAAPPGAEPDDGGGEEGACERGTVRWFDERRGYGFIARESAVDVFFHGSAVLAPRRLTTGDRVRFVVVDAPRGLQARSIHLDRPIAGDEDGTSGEPPA
ncbi:MAG TPA: cold shock domain-containing protein [Thermoanaerobaculia bacterium]|nr:cold shock domain-containing protein [Thermoanaerobaculia bacterium]